MALAVTSCKHEPTDEEQGAVLLEEARQLLGQGDLQAARDTILSMRQRFPHAISVRKQAILTLDSVELQQAILDGDSLKTEFYLRKLEFDKDPDSGAADY